MPVKLSEIRSKFPMYGDMPDDQFLIAIRNKFYPDLSPGQFFKQVEYDTARLDPTKDMSGTEKFLAGAGKGITDLARGAGQWVGAVDRQDVAEARKRDKALMNTGAGVAGNITGTLAALVPTAFLPGANTVAGGAALGLGTGALQPSESTLETVLNMGLGGVAGAAVPAATRAISTARAATEPFSTEGQKRIIGRAIQRAAGNDAKVVAQRVKDAAQPFVGPSQGTPRTIMGELVPGSVPTVAQVADNAGVSSLSRAAAAANPQVTNAIDDIMSAQNTARLELLQDLAGEGGRREFFTAARDATANQLYGAARKAGVSPQALTPEAQANIAAFAQRVPDAVIQRAKQLAQISGESMDNATSVQGMHWLKTAVDDMIGSAKRSGDAEMAKALTGLKTDLLKGMDAMSPGYQLARQTYEAMSKPINQMAVAKEVMDKSVNPLTQSVQPQAFARALSDASAKRATGFQGATLENTLTNQQQNQLSSILLDLQRANRAQTAGRGPGSDTVQKLAYVNILEEAGVPTFLRNFGPTQVIGNLGGRVADVAYGRANRELSNRLAEVLLDPAQAAEMLTLVTQQAPNRIAELLSRSASGAMLSTPAIANAQK